MDIKLHEIQGVSIAEVVADEVCVSSGQGVLDIIGGLYGLDTERVILHEHQLDPAFFNLRSGLAGDVVQKFVNYGLKFAVVGEFEKYQSAALRDFIYEANKGRQMVFAASLNEALDRLAAL